MGGIGSSFGFNPLIDQLFQRFGQQISASVQDGADLAMLQRFLGGMNAQDIFQRCAPQMQQAQACYMPQLPPQQCLPQIPFCMPQCFPQQFFDCFPGASPQPQMPSFGKTFDVWFENKDGQKAQQRSPIVLDLNGNGRPDLTGNVGVENGRWVAKGGNNKVDFDIDPSKRSWEAKSIARRPGKGAPDVPGGYAKVYDANGQLIADRAPLDQAVGRSKGQGIKDGRAEVYDKNGQLVGELKRDTEKGQMMYHYGKRKDAEKTEWMAAGNGDALLVWDVNRDGKIDSSKELFGEFDVDGQKRFNNGYEKLAAYFDQNRDGAVDQRELQYAQAAGVAVWKDTNGNAKTEAGELQSLDQNGVRALGTQFDPRDMSSGFLKGGGRW
jgi:hypothetical protein